METGKVAPLEDEDKESSILSRNSKITEFLELCIQPKNKKEMETIVSNFWKKYEDFSASEIFCEFDIACMYAFDFVYKENTECLAAVSRSLYAYLDQGILVLKHENRNVFINCGNYCFISGLRKFENFDSEEGMVILVQSQMGSLMKGNIGCAHFLVKFGLVDFPPEVNERYRKMVAELVNWFNEYNIINVEADGIQMEGVLHRMAHSEISSRRSMIIFCAVCIVAEYGLYEKLCVIAPEEPCLISFANRMKLHCVLKMNCLDLYIATTTETKITFREIEIFAATILNPHLGTQFASTLVETSRKILSEAHEFFNPRSLKDLTRCKIRACVPSSMVLTEQVKQFTIPETLKQFILFHREEIWGSIIQNQVTMHSIKLLSRRITEIQNARNN